MGKQALYPYFLRRHMANNNNHQFKITEDGYKELKKELGALVDVKRPAVVERLSNARSMGDLSENSDYHQAKEALEFLDGRIAELETILVKASIVKKASKSGEVSVGSKVKVRSNGSEHIFHIVGEWEADPKYKKISHESPLGKALVGKRVGDSVEIAAPAGKVVYKVLAIE